MPSAQLVRDLRGLRRFARALTGSMARGDAYVEASLRSIGARGSRLRGHPLDRILLFRAFLRVWLPAQPVARARTSLTETSGGLHAADRRLQALTPLSRAVLLLCELEGFDRSEVAEILTVSPDAVGRLVARAQNEIGRVLATRILIVEDESRTAEQLCSIVRDMGHRLVGIAPTRRHAVRMARYRRPGLVLVDTDTIDTGNVRDEPDLAASLGAASGVPIIVVTASPERVGGPYTLPKPCRAEEVRSVLGEALFRDGAEAGPRPALPAGTRQRRRRMPDRFRSLSAGRSAGR